MGASPDTKTFLAIETSCDETAVAIIDVRGTTITVRTHLVFSQASLHATFGGVFPNLAKREHAKALPPLLTSALTEAQLATNTPPPKELPQKIQELLIKDTVLSETLIPFIQNTNIPSIDGIAVTYGPGLEPALWVGLNTARALAYAWNVPLYPMNHMEGHIAAALLSETAQNETATHHSYTLTDPPVPALAILLSGGHTEFDLIRRIGDYERIGETQDDAVGEAYDKVARLLGLPYPGGPLLAQKAQEARTRRIQSPIKLPRPMVTSGNLHTSFSGLKTAVRYAVEKITPLTDQDTIGIAREFEDAVTEVLIRKTHAAIEATGVESLILGGGVVANEHLRTAFGRLAQEHGIPLLAPHPALATDNALMIATALAARHIHGCTIAKDPFDTTLKACGTLRLA